MEDSILKTTKKLLGLSDDYDVFDLDIILHINSALMTLSDLGVGQSSGFTITDDSSMWADFIPNDSRLNAIKTYVAQKVRLAFDPPQNQFAVIALQDQIKEAEWRINVRQEATDYVTPGDPPALWTPSGMDNPIHITNGLSWWISFTYKTDEGTPISVTDVKMEFRQGTEKRGRVLYTTEGANPSLLVDYSQSPKVIVTLPGDATANKEHQEAWFDAWAISSDNGERVLLMNPRFVNFHSNVSEL